ncbi:anti-sigma factor [Arsukibacterium sp.]|uniref:anti-sigma factor n=1 Tax=Arsukibacterium sp. TaxID=1977258 RepID=UPI001BD43314|nr:anti-sigma factor [Arsukibacterium sp.]
MNEQQFEQSLQHLARERQPERDLWPAIAARLELTHQQPGNGAPVPMAVAAQHHSPRLIHWASAAAFLLVALIGWQLAILPAAGQRTVASPSAELILLQVYEQQKSRQLAQVVAVAEGFDNWQQQLTIWDQAIAQVRLALQFYPDEPQLLAQLQQLYQQQLRFIQQATLQQPSITS